MLGSEVEACYCTFEYKVCSFIGRLFLAGKDNHNRAKLPDCILATI